MYIDLAFSPAELEKKDLRNKTVVVIDALRATSTMITAFENGCAGFIPVATIEEAQKLFADLNEPNLLLGGERRALPVAGFHLGNSPRDYRPEKVNNKMVIMTTTNGTQALVAARQAGEVFIGAFLNLTALCRRLQEAGRDILIACAGEKGFFCLEDTVCGGAMIEHLGKDGLPVQESDSALAAKILYEYFAADIYGMLAACEWGRYLEKMGLGKDIRICAQIDSSKLVPIYREGKVYLDR
ncbi:MAG: 2-phosphosulfolactate phosphatase [Pseudomonadota bacterium]